MRNNNENYLEKIPVISSRISWDIDDSGKVTINKENYSLFLVLMGQVNRQLLILCAANYLKITVK